MEENFYEEEEGKKEDELENLSDIDESHMDYRYV